MKTNEVRTCYYENEAKYRQLRFLFQIRANIVSIMLEMRRSCVKYIEI